MLPLLLRNTFLHRNQNQRNGTVVPAVPFLWWTNIWMSWSIIFFEAMIHSYSHVSLSECSAPVLIKRIHQLGMVVKKFRSSSLCSSKIIPGLFFVYSDPSGEGYSSFISPSVSSFIVRLYWLFCLKVLSPGRMLPTHNSSRMCIIPPPHGKRPQPEHLLQLRTFCFLFCWPNPFVSTAPLVSSPFMHRATPQPSLKV